MAGDNYRSLHDQRLHMWPDRCDWCGRITTVAFRDTLIDRDPASTGMCTLKRYRKKSFAASIFFSERSRTTVSS